MKFRLLLLILIWMVGAVDISAHQIGPANGYRTIAPLTEIVGSCVSFRVTGARILLSRSTLVWLSRNTAHQDRTYPLSRLAGERATLLLGAASTTLDELGCAKIVFDDASQREYAAYLVGQFIEDKQAVVVRDRAVRPESAIVVHDYDRALGGTRDFEFIGGGVFFSLVTWES